MLLTSSFSCYNLKLNQQFKINRAKLVNLKNNMPINELINQPILITSFKILMPNSLAHNTHTNILSDNWMQYTHKYLSIVSFI